MWCIPAYCSTARANGVNVSFRSATSPTNFVKCAGLSLLVTPPDVWSRALPEHLFWRAGRYPCYIRVKGSLGNPLQPENRSGLYARVSPVVKRAIRYLMPSLSRTTASHAAANLSAYLRLETNAFTWERLAAVGGAARGAALAAAVVFSSIAASSSPSSGSSSPVDNSSSDAT